MAFRQRPSVTKKCSAIFFRYSYICRDCWFTHAPKLHRNTKSRYSRDHPQQKLYPMQKTLQSIMSAFLFLLIRAFTDSGKCTMEKRENLQISDSRKTEGAVCVLFFLLNIANIFFFYEMCLLDVSASPQIYCHLWTVLKAVHSNLSGHETLYIVHVSSTAHCVCFSENIYTINIQPLFEKADTDPKCKGCG